MNDETLWVPAVIALAIAFDQCFGEPSNRWHPVAWMGSLLNWGQARLDYGSPCALLVRGGTLVLTVAGLAWVSAWAISAIAGSLGWAGVLLEAIVLKLLISLRGLTDACRSVRQALAAGDLIRARSLAGYHLVSRETTTLDAGQLASATIESGAENLTDAFVGPLCYYIAFGLAGACAYRAINTADAMVGYRQGSLEYFGKPAARLDDLTNLIPARIAALALVLAAGLLEGRAGNAWRMMQRDHGRTASPNAGWTMAAMAGALGVALEKIGAYGLGEGSAPKTEHIDRSLRLVRTGALGAALSLLCAWWLTNYSH